MGYDFDFIDRNSEIIHTLVTQASDSWAKLLTQEERTKIKQEYDESIAEYGTKDYEDSPDEVLRLYQEFVKAVVYGDVKTVDAFLFARLAQTIDYAVIVASAIIAFKRGRINILEKLLAHMDEELASTGEPELAAITLYFALTGSEEVKDLDLVQYIVEEGHVSLEEKKNVNNLKQIFDDELFEEIKNYLGDHYPGLHARYIENESFTITCDKLLSKNEQSFINKYI